MIIDRVYKLVQDIASKDEATGYISDIEFNRLGSMAELQKLDEDLRLNNEGTTASMQSLSSFKTTAYVSVVNGIVSKPTDYRTFQSAMHNNINNGEIIPTPFEELGDDEWNWRNASILDRPSKDYPALTSIDGALRIMPTNINQISLTYIKNPQPIVWDFTISNGRKVFNPAGATVDFTFDEEDIPNLVFRICTLAGISFREAELVSASSRQEDKNLQL